MNRLRDPVTGLWNEDFFHASTRVRLAVARRELRPLTVVLIAFGTPAGVVATDDHAARTAAYAFLRTIRDSDQACRLEAGRFGVLLEATDQRGAVLCVDRIRGLLGEDGHRLVVWAGVACYPTHSLDADDLVYAATNALADAMRWDTSRVETAVPQ